jgi:hypothetical protein
MRSCCPPGRGCNAPDGDEPCALTLCSMVADEESEAALALERWDELQDGSGDEARAERRFRRRAFERTRDRALQAVAMHLTPAMLARARARGVARIGFRRRVA